MGLKGVPAVGLEPSGPPPLWAWGSSVVSPLLEASSSACVRSAAVPEMLPGWCWAQLCPVAGPLEPAMSYKGQPWLLPAEASTQAWTHNTLSFGYSCVCSFCQLEHLLLKAGAAQCHRCLTVSLTLTRRYNQVRKRRKDGISLTQIVTIFHSRLY